MVCNDAGNSIRDIDKFIIELDSICFKFFGRLSNSRLLKPVRA